MKAEVGLRESLTAARMVKPYAQVRHWSRQQRPVLVLRTSGGLLTLAAGDGEETGEVDLPGAISDGACAVAADTLVKTLTALRPKGRTAKAATVTLLGEADHLHLSVDGNRTTSAGIDVETPPPASTGLVGPAGQPLAAGPVDGWCDLVAKVATAACRDQAFPPVTALRFAHAPGSALLIEATDRYRAHRAHWGNPATTNADVLVAQAAAVRAVKLVSACDPGGRINVDTDTHYIRWRTETVRVAARTQCGQFPELERIWDARDEADVTFTVARAEVLAALDTAVRLAATTGVPIQLEPRPADGRADVAVYSDSGQPAYRTTIEITDGSGPACAMRFNPTYAKEAFLFTDDPSVHVAASTSRLPVYLHSEGRDAVVMRLRPT